jgi:transcriptional regulator with XRE-family HTH domain
MSEVDGLSQIKFVFGVNLRSIRAKRKITQTGLSKIVGVSHNFITDIEAGRKCASFALISKLAEALESEPYEFFLPLERSVESSIIPSGANRLPTLFQIVEDIKTEYYKT